MPLRLSFQHRHKAPPVNLPRRRPPARLDQRRHQVNQTHRARVDDPPSIFPATEPAAASEFPRHTHLGDRGMVVHERADAQDRLLERRDVGLRRPAEPLEERERRGATAPSRSRRRP